MKRAALTLATLAALSLALGCDRGPPTLMPTITFPPTKTPVPTANVRRQATLRAGPGVDYAVAGTAQFGEHMVVYAQCDGWLQVSSDASKWIIEGKVILNVDLDEIPFICRVSP
jgi:hypothetical protein